MQVEREEAEEAREAEQRAAARDAEIVARAARTPLRVDDLGADRHHRRYALLRHAPDLVWVEAADGVHIGVLHSAAQVEAVAAALLPRGPREKALAATLSQHRAPLLAALGAADGGAARLRGLLLDSAEADLRGPALDAADAMDVDPGAPPDPPPIVTLACAGARVYAGLVVPVGHPPGSPAAAVAQVLRHSVAYVRKFLSTLLALDTGREAVQPLLPKLDGVRDLPGLIVVRPSTPRSPRRHASAEPFVRYAHGGCAACRR